MRKLTIILVLLAVVLIQLMGVYVCFASPSSNLYEEGDDIFDDWHVSRTRGWDEDGFLQVIDIVTEEGSDWTFRPVITFESLGEYADIAYRFGEQAADKYPDRYQRAEQIFYFVRDRVRYSLDKDQFGLDEFAQNADELATTIDENGIAYGDCEDMAILLAVMYQGAGYRSAIVVGPSHVAAMVYLPDYKKAMNFKLNGEPGWIWAEATGNTNPFGAFPRELEGYKAYEISAESIPLWQLPEEEEPPPVASVTPGGPNVLIMILPLFIVVAIMGVIILLLRRRRQT